MWNPFNFVTEKDVLRLIDEKRGVKNRKSKKEKESPFSSALRLAVESGKVEFGSKAGLNCRSFG